MSIGLYIHVTRAAGVILSADLYNSAHRNHLTNDIPASCGAHSDDLTMFQATTDPYPGAIAAPVIALGTELEQLRFVLTDIKTFLNGGTPPAQWYTPVVVPSSAQQAFGARVFDSTFASIPASTLERISFDTVTYDTGVGGTDFFSFGDPTKVTAPINGLYALGAFLEWTSGVTSGALAMAIVLNGSKTIAAYESTADVNAVERRMSCGADYALVAGDYLELIVFQSTPSNPLNINANATLWIELLNPQQIVPPSPALDQVIIRTYANWGPGFIHVLVPSAGIDNTYPAPNLGTTDIIDLDTISVPDPTTDFLVEAFDSDGITPYCLGDGSGQTWNISLTTVAFTTCGGGAPYKAIFTVDAGVDILPGAARFTPFFE
jgi:hypothetical protein